MPLYSFTSKEGKTIEEFFSMKKIPKSIRRKHVRYARDLGAELSGGPKSGSRGEWPIVCYASGVHADQAQELRDHFKDHGCPTDVTSEGDPVYRDHQHRKRALKCRGICDRASFSG